MARDPNAEAVLASARERLREHLIREAEALADDDAEGVLPEVEQLAERLGRRA